MFEDGESGRVVELLELAKVVEAPRTRQGRGVAEGRLLAGGGNDVGPAADLPAREKGIGAEIDAARAGVVGEGLEAGEMLWELVLGIEAGAEGEDHHLEADLRRLIDRPAHRLGAGVKEVVHERVFRRPRRQGALESPHGQPASLPVGGILDEDEGPEALERVPRCYLLGRPAERAHLEEAGHLLLVIDLRAVRRVFPPADGMAAGMFVAEAAEGLIGLDMERVGMGEVDPRRVVDRIGGLDDREVFGGEAVDGERLVRTIRDDDPLRERGQAVVELVVDADGEGRIVNRGGEVEAGRHPRRRPGGSGSVMTRALPGEPLDRDAGLDPSESEGLPIGRHRGEPVRKEERPVRLADEPADPMLGAVDRHQRLGAYGAEETAVAGEVVEGDGGAAVLEAEDTANETIVERERGPVGRSIGPRLEGCRIEMPVDPADRRSRGSASSALSIPGLRQADCGDHGARYRHARQARPVVRRVNHGGLQEE